METWLTVVMFYCCRFLSCLQAGASYIWSYWPAYTSSICGLVWMRGADPWEVVTQQEEGHWYQGQLFCILLQALTFKSPALKHRLLPATMKRHHYEFITASQKENIVLLNNSMYIITMHFLYKAVCIWGKKTVSDSYFICSQYCFTHFYLPELILFIQKLLCKFCVYTDKE